METGLADRQFYANFGTLSEDEARELFTDYYGRQPQDVVSLNDTTIAGPVTKIEVKQSYFTGKGE